MKYQEYLERKQREYGDKFDVSELSKQFEPYFDNGLRVKVETLGETVTGTVSVTTGWKPAFLLMRTARSHGSSYVLSDKDRIIGYKHPGSRSYVNVA